MPRISVEEQLQELPHKERCGWRDIKWDVQVLISGQDGQQSR